MSRDGSHDYNNFNRPLGKLGMIGVLRYDCGHLRCDGAFVSLNARLLRWKREKSSISFTALLIFQKLPI